MKQNLIDRLAARAKEPCHVPGCKSNCYRLYPRCFYHQKAYVRFGNEKGRYFNEGIFKKSKAEVKEVLDLNLTNNPGISYCIDRLQTLIDTATPNSNYYFDLMRQFGGDTITGYTSLLTAASVYRFYDSQGIRNRLIHTDYQEKVVRSIRVIKQLNSVKGLNLWTPKKPHLYQKAHSQIIKILFERYFNLAFVSLSRACSMVINKEQAILDSFKNLKTK
ncbi:MAG: hypothetical protein JRJ00_00715 [Deltaproteobacteria bacterium]|nr:hypothetical protein [Deltaproteobacteria bacterium]